MLDLPVCDHTMIQDNASCDAYILANNTMLPNYRAFDAGAFANFRSKSYHRIRGYLRLLVNERSASWVRR